MNPTDSPTRSVIVEKVLPHPPEKIWRALTEAPLIGDWLMANDFLPVVGHQFTLRATPVPHWDGIIEGEVLLVEAHRKLAYRWGALGQDTVVTWTLTASEGGTRLRMEHTGFRHDQEANLRGATSGWQKFTGALEKMLAGMPVA